MLRRTCSIFLLALVAGCSAPDYSAVRNWADTASFAAEYPPAANDASLAEARHAAGRSVVSDSVLSMQQALSIYLSSLGTIAADGVLPYREDPFVELAQRAAPGSEAGAAAIRTLGGLLRRATVRNSRAPQLRETIAATDEPLQSVVGALRASVAGLATMEAEERRAVAAEYDALLLDARGAPAQRALRDLAALRDRELALRAAARANYLLVLARIAEGHALLKASARHITQEETIRQIRAAEDQLRRVSAALPRMLAAPGPVTGGETAPGGGPVGR